MKINEETVKIVYDLFKTFFVNEYKSQAEFKAYLREPQDLLLFYEKTSGSLVGFIILRKASYDIDGYFFRIVEAVCKKVYFTENSGFLWTEARVSQEFLTVNVPYEVLHEVQVAISLLSDVLLLLDVQLPKLLVLWTHGWRLLAKTQRRYASKR